MEKLKNVKVIFIDIDGTLTNKNREVTVENARAIYEAVNRGIYVVLCSGRSVQYAIEKSKDANASKYIIVNNGSQIYDYEKATSLYEKVITKDIVEKLLKDFKEYGIECILNTSEIRFGTENLKRKLSSLDRKFYDLDEIPNNHILQIIAEASTIEEMNNLVDIVNRYKELKISNISKDFLEKKESKRGYYADINSNESDKGNGIREFLRAFNLNKEEALCFGDYINDIDMFEACGYKVAMENASEELKKNADYVTLSNNDSGIAYFMDKYIL